MNAFKTIRQRLGVTQAEIAGGVGVSQGNVSLYENGQTVPPDVATKLIAFAHERGLTVSYDVVYGAAELDPPAEVLPGKARRRAVAEAKA